MKKLLKFHDTYTLKILVCLLLLFTALYPKLPSIHIMRTWVYIRLEDFLILVTVLVWLIQVFRKKVSLPIPFVASIGSYWLVGLVSIIISIIFISPHLSNFFPHLAVLSYFRRIEYMILFFVAFSTIKNAKDVRTYFIILSVTVFGVFLYGMGQRYYLYLWEAWPKFFEQYPFCFPSFQTGNEEFAKGLPLCLPKEARITATFGGHYDLAGYLVVVLPIFIGVFIAVKKWFWRLSSGFLFVAGLALLNFTASRTSFIAYFIGSLFTLIIFRKKWYIIPVVLVSLLVLVAFSDTTAKRLLDTIRISSVVTNSQGQVVGEALPTELKNKISKETLEAPPPAQNLPKGSAIIGLPQQKTPVATDVAMVKKTISAEEAKRLNVAVGSIQISTVSGTFLVQKALVYDISLTTRFQSEWPNAWNAFIRNPLTGSGYSSITLATDGDYFRAIGETGLLGIITFVLIFVIFGIAFKHLIHRVESPVIRGFAYGLAGGVVGLAVNAALIDVFEASKVAENLWLLLGIGMGGLYLYKEKAIPYVRDLKTIFTSNFMIAIYLFSIVLAIFLPSVGTFFVADDFTWLRWAASATQQDLYRYFIDSQNFFYRPLDKLVTFFLYTVFAFQPEGYHSVMLILHFLCVFAVYLLVLYILKSKFWAFLAALLFLMHPSHAENIYWFSGLSGMLASLFMLYASLCFIWFRKRHSLFGYLLAWLLTVFAFLSYEMAVITPLLFVVIDLFLIKPKKKLSTFLTYIPFVLLWPAYCVTRMFTNTFSGGGDYSYNIAQLIPNVVGNFFGYIGVFIGGMNFLPVYVMLRNTLREERMLAVGIIIVSALVIGIVIYTLRKKLVKSYKDPVFNQILFGFSFAFVSLLPFLPLGNIADRYLYLASAGFCLVVIVFVRLLISALPVLHGYGRWVALILILMMVAWYHSEQLTQQKKWAKAGEITYDTLLLLRSNSDKFTQAATIYFVNTPVTYDGIWVFPTGIKDGMWFIYREGLPQVHQAASVQQARDTIHATTTDQSQSYIIQFDKNGKILIVE